MENPLKTVHLVGAQKTNYPWGFENRLFPVFEKLGWKVISTDFRQEADVLPARLQQPCDLVLFCKAERVQAELIRSVKYPTFLWWAELLGSVDKTDELADSIRKSLVHNVQAYDHVFLHDEMSIPLVQSWGAKSVSCLPSAVANPDVQKKLDVEKKYDVCFVGQITPRREKFLQELKKEVSVHVAKVWDPDELNLLFNESKIVLNIHSSVLLNTETRVGEVLGAGAFFLTEELSSPNLFQDGEHCIYTRSDDISDMAAKVKYYLEHEEEREKIAKQGHDYVHIHHTLTNRIEEIITKKIKKQPYLYWPAVLGILKDESGQETNNLLDFYKAVEVAHA
jgi:spore maturation protein CgeB